MRKAGDVCFAEVSRDNEGLITYVFHPVLRIANFFFIMCKTVSTEE